MLRRPALAALLFSAMLKPYAAEPPGEVCRNLLVTELELLPLREKVSLGSLKDQTFRMMTDETKPTKEEKEAIVRWVEKRKDCYKLDEDLRHSFPPKAQLVLEAQQAEFEQAALDLYSGKITYGGFAQRRSDLMSKTKAQLADVVADVQKDQAGRKSQACESARREVMAVCSSDSPKTNIQINNGSGSISSNDGVRPWNGTAIVQCNAAKQHVVSACN